MSVMKKFLLGVIALLSIIMTSAAIAGGPDVPPPPPSDNGIYLEGNVGYAHVNWADVFGPSIFTENRRGGFTFGFDVGYQWNPFISLETGWFYLPKARWFVTPDAARFSDWFVYLAAKLMAPVAQCFDLFIKAGIGYRRVTFGGASTGSVRAVRPVFGAGGQFHFGREGSFLLNFQYMYFPSGNTVVMNGAVFFPGLSLPAPAAHLFTAGIGYLLAI